MTAYRYKVMKTAGKNLNDLLQDMGYKSDQSYVFRKTATFADKCGMERLRRSLDILMDADVKSKSTAVQPETLLTELISKLAAVR